MNKFFDNFYNYKGFGPATHSIETSQEVLDFYHDKLPKKLLDYWLEYGFSSWGKGIFWTVNPKDYEEALAYWLRGTEFEERQLLGVDKYHVIAIGAFGRMFIWGETSGQSIKINPGYAMILPTNKTEDLNKFCSERCIELFFATMSKDLVDEKDLDDRLLFERALEKLGPLENGEIYGFVPALALGGEPKLENLQKVKATEHLAFLADLGEKRVMADIVALSNQLPHNQ